MMFIAVVAFLITLLGQGFAQDAGLLPCASGCVTGVFANSAAIGCPLNDRLCVCGKSTDFANGIRDCISQACPSDAVAGQLSIAQGYGNEECQIASSAAGVQSSPTPTPSKPTSAAESKPTQQAPTSTPTTMVTMAVESAKTSASSPSPASSSKAASSEGAFSAANAEPTASDSTSAVAEPTAASSVTMLVSQSSATPSDSGAIGAATASADKSGDGAIPSDDGGLSVGARAGIGAGVGVAAVLIIILAVFILRRRKNQPGGDRIQTMQISQPLPGSGRQFADSVSRPDATLSKDFLPPAQSMRAQSPVARPYSPSAGSYASELDANARPYEELTPRTQPRTMI